MGRPRHKLLVGCGTELLGADWESCLADTSGLESLEAAGEPDEAWQKLYQRLEQQRVRSGSLGTAQVIPGLDLSVPCHP